MASTEGNLYSRVVYITTLYLGPAAERFIARQIQTHLDKEPEDLTRKDLEQLVEWIRIAIALLTEDAKVVEEFYAKLMALTRAEPDRR
jgi:hypothetical protein